jgi:hypothetical protein
MYHHDTLTDDQARARLALTTRINTALAAGQQVPCVGDWRHFDTETSDPVQACAGCPVIAACRRYADTGAVRWGIIAGRLASPSASGQEAA